MDSSSEQRKNIAETIAGKWLVCLEWDKKKKCTRWRVGRIKNVLPSDYNWEFEYLGRAFKSAAAARETAKIMNEAIAII